MTGPRTASDTSLHRLLGTLALSVTCACSSPDERSCSSDGAESAVSALIGASEQERYLAVSPPEAEQIGILSAEGSNATCSAVRVAPDWLLTAGHCSGLDEFVGLDGVSQRIGRVVVHPDRDLALMQVAECAPTGASGLRVAEMGAAPLVPTRLTLAGFGVDEAGSIGALKFLVEPVVAMDDSTVTVDGSGRTGACAGDSGGPALVRDQSGQVAVLGVLSTGDPTCRGVDIYVRVDNLRSWIAGHVGFVVPASSCGDITASGRCFDERAVWCHEGTIAIESCSGDTNCGWSEEEQGFRCSAAPLCLGDERGQCLDTDHAIHCGPSGLETIDCAAMRDVCGFDAITGEATCNRPEPGR